MTPQPANQQKATAIAAFAIVAIAFAANAFFNHTPTGAGVKTIPGFYRFVYFIGLGVLVPAWLLGKITLGGAVTARQLGIGADKRDALALVVALVAGGALAAVPLMPFLRDPAGPRLLHGLFAQLLIASTAEVLLFLGVLGAGIEALLGRRGDWLTHVAIVVASCIAFGLYHFTYPAPWNTLQLAATLSLTWIPAALLFAVGRSLLAAILYNNIMATVGFATNRLTLPQSALEGWLLAGVALAGFLLMFRHARR